MNSFPMRNHTMLKSIATAAAVLLACAASIPAHAAPPADQDACNKLAFDLAEKAAGKKLAEADAVKVDEMINTLQTQCGEGKLSDAETTAKNIETAIGK